MFYRKPLRQDVSKKMLAAEFAKIGIIIKQSHRDNIVETVLSNSDSDVLLDDDIDDCLARGLLDNYINTNPSIRSSKMMDIMDAKLSYNLSRYRCSAIDFIDGRRLSYQLKFMTYFYNVSNAQDFYLNFVLYSHLTEEDINRTLIDMSEELSLSVQQLRAILNANGNEMPY